MTDRDTNAPLWASHQHAVVDDDEPPHWPINEEAIRLRAYFISLETGGHDPEGDWRRAEAEFRAEAGEKQLATSRERPEHASAEEAGAPRQQAIATPSERPSGQDKSKTRPWRFVSP